MQADVQKMMDLYRQMNNFGKDNGIEFTMNEPGDVELTMTVLEKHLSSPNTCHGGVIAGFMDATIGASALSKSFTEFNLVSTVEFKINYFKPVYLGDILKGRGTIEYKGKSLISSSGEIYNETRGELVSKALGTFNIYPLAKKDMGEFTPFFEGKS